MKSRKTILLVSSLLLGTPLFASGNAGANGVDKKNAANTESSALMIVQQNRTIKGTVLDELGEPIIGANVLVKGTATGTITDFDGNFSLEVGANQMLEVSYIGYVTQTVKPVNGMQIILKEDAKALDEVVVTALGIKKEAKSLSYNVQQLKSNEATKLADANFVNNLNGKIAGVTINSSSTGVGGSSRVVMRGAKSISGNNNALYVIDGVPMMNNQADQATDLYGGAGSTGDAVSNLNPDDIESISVLSGPSAAALYGSSAANGVVMITTKKGTTGKAQVTLTNTTQFSDILKMHSFQNTYGVSETGSYQSWGDKLANPSAYKPQRFFQTGYNVTNAVSISAGNERNQTYLSLGNVDSEGIIPNNEFKRYNFSVRNTTELVQDKLTMDINFSGSFVEEQNMTAQGQYNNPMTAVYLFPAGDDFAKMRLFERQDPGRNFPIQWFPYDAGKLSMQNPYWIVNRNMFNNNKDRYMATLQFKYKIADWINVSARGKLDNTSSKYQKRYYATTNQLFASKNGYYALRHANESQKYGEFLVNINKYFGAEKAWNLTANIGASINDQTYETDTYEGKLWNLPNKFTTTNIDPSTQKNAHNGYHIQEQGIFGSAQLGFKSMVYLDVTARNDWSSTFAGSNTESFFYPTIGLSGIMTDIFPKLQSKAFNYMKLRVSYSEVGNRPDPFLTIPTYAITSGTAATTTVMPNRDLKPERTKSWEVGANFAFLDNELKLDVTAYSSRTMNQIFNPPLSASTGYTSVYVNGGRVDNKGIEASLRFNHDFNRDLNWESYVTYSLNKNKIVTLLDNWYCAALDQTISQREMNMASSNAFQYKLKEGGRIGDLYVSTLKTDEHGAVYVNPQSKTVEIDANNYVYAGNTAPKYNLAWGNTVTFKGFKLGFQLNARVGGIVLSETQAAMDYYGISKRTGDARDNGGVKVNGYLIPAKEFFQTIGNEDGGIGAYYVYSATNVRLGEVTLGYDFPITKWVKWIKGLNVTLVGRNLALLYCKAPFDPEATANTGTYYQGIDYFMTPSQRNIGFSVKVKL